MAMSAAERCLDGMVRSHSEHSLRKRVLWQGNGSPFEVLAFLLGGLTSFGARCAFGFSRASLSSGAVLDEGAYATSLRLPIHAGPAISQTGIRSDLRAGDSRGRVRHGSVHAASAGRLIFGYGVTASEIWPIGWGTASRSAGGGAAGGDGGVAQRIGTGENVSRPRTRPDAVRLQPW